MAIVLPAQDQLIDSLKRKNVAFAALFGSRAKGMEKSDSDYDFLIEFQPEARYTLFDIVDVKDDLQEILHSPVDVITTAALNPRLKDEILGSLQVLYDERQR